VSFEDLDEERTWLFDVTFLTSGWSCIYGAGCQGVLTGPAADLVQGCCSYGAHFSSEEDVARVTAAAATLEATDWQHRDTGLASGFIRRDGDDTTTALVDDACIFLNRPGFPGGPGCALHRAALQRRVQPLTLKPDVCWQLPLRREDTVDDRGHVTTTVSEWSRRHWGEAGSEFHWWCTDAREAFIAQKPVYRTLVAELRELVGERVYKRLRAYLDERVGSGTPLAHPAVRRRSVAKGVPAPHDT